MISEMLYSNLLPGPRRSLCWIARSTSAAGLSHQASQNAAGLRSPGAGRLPGAPADPALAPLMPSVTARFPNDLVVPMGADRLVALVAGFVLRLGWLMQGCFRFADIDGRRRRFVRFPSRSDWHAIASVLRHCFAFRPI